MAINRLTQDEMNEVWDELESSGVMAEFLKRAFPEGLPNSANQSTSLSSSNNISGSLETNKDK